MYSFFYSIMFPWDSSLMVRLKLITRECRFLFAGGGGLKDKCLCARGGNGVRRMNLYTCKKRVGSEDNSRDSRDNNNQ